MDRSQHFDEGFPFPSHDNPSGPRGTLFPSLNDAHRIITSRSEYKNPPRKGLEKKGDPCEGIPLKDLPSQTFPCDPNTMNAVGAQPRTARNEYVLSYVPRPAKGRSLTGHHSFLAKSTGRVAGTLPGDGVFQGKENSKGGASTETNNADTSNSTLGQIMEHYTTKDSDMLSTSLGSSGGGYTFSQVQPIDQRGHRYARPDVGTQPSTHETRDRTTEIPRCDPRPEAVSTTIMGPSDRPLSPSTTRSFLPRPCTNRPLGTSPQDMMPMPLRVPATKNTQASSRAEAESDTQSSMSGTSDGDHFKYDSPAYRAILRKGEQSTPERQKKEREVSQHLRKMQLDETAGGASRGSQAALDHLLYKDVRPKASVIDQSPRPEAGDVKVLIHKKPSPRSEEQSLRQPATTFGVTIERKRDPPSIPFGFSIERNKDVSRQMTNDEDWVTEPASDIDLSIGSSAPDQYHLTGSSVADFSESDYMPSYADRIPSNGSQEPILQHPPAHKGGASETYDIRKLKGTDQQVSLPRPQLNRFNGFAQDSLRLKGTSKPDDTAKGILKSPNPFTPPGHKGHSRKNASENNHFAFGIDKSISSKYEFRDSLSEYNIPFESNRATRGNSCSTILDESSMLSEATTVPRRNPFAHPDDTPEEVKNKGTDPMLVRKVRQGHENQALHNIMNSPVTSNIYDAEPSSAASRFEFPLLGLADAQRIQKLQRERGETDETDDTAARKRARDTMNSRFTMTPTPAPVPPAGVHMSRQTLAQADSRPILLQAGLRLSSAFSPDGFLSSPDPVSRRLFSPSPQTPDTPGIPSPYYNSQASTVVHGDQPRVIRKDNKHARVNTMRSHVRSLLHTGRPAAAQDLEDARLSWDARRRRQTWFRFMAGLSILPFIAVLVLYGFFDDSLAWYTKGEVSRLTVGQRRTIKIMLMIEGVVYAVVVLAMVVFVVVTAATPSTP